MNRKYLIMFAFAIALAGCTKDSEMTVEPVKAEKNNTATVSTQQPVQFGAYVNRATTRAGMVGPLTTKSNVNNLQTDGFGVMAYYTDDDLYSPIYVPNFMYNTEVKYNNTANAWTYEPVQYWPNETGENAASEGIDRLSFFAYAPYVDVTNSTGIVSGDATYGIVGLSRNGAVGDPWVKYYASLDPTKQVDFCWSTPQIDKTKPTVTDKVNLVFNHALAALNVQVDAMIDELTPGNNTLADETHIYVRSITFEGFVTKGAFNLNTEQPTWYDLAGANYIDGGSVTIFDGQTNGKEGQSNAANESPLGLNPVIVQSAPYGDAALTAGVTTTAVNLLNGETNAPIYVIPSGQPLTVTIVYDVETATDELPGYLSDGVTHGTTVENKITKSVTFGTGQTATNKLEASKQYNLSLHLGLTSVKFDATVNNWSDNTVTGSNLPENTIGVGSVVLSETSTTKWIGESVPSPTVTVKDTENNTMTDGVTFTWSSSDTSVATVDQNTGAITVVGPGTTTITVTADNGTSNASTDFTVNINGVTGISINPAGINMTPGTSATLTVTITHTNYDTFSLPDDLQPVVSGANSSNVTVTLDTNNPKSTSGTTTTYHYIVANTNTAATNDIATATFTLGSPYKTTQEEKTVDINVVDNPSDTNNASGQKFTWDN